MPGLTTSDFFQQIVEFHRQCVDLYEEAIREVDDAQVAALLRHLADHERRLATSIERYVERSSPEWLASTLQFAASLDSCADLGLSLGADVTEALEALRQRDQKLIRFCERAIGESATRSVTDPLRAVAWLEKATKHRAVSVALELIQS